jgi:cytochrome d ubiquinol oxidase subunit II
VLGGLTLTAFSLAHGATFLSLRTSGDLAVRQRRIAIGMTWITALLMIAFSVWTFVSYTDGKAGALVIGALAGGSLLAAAAAHLRGHAFVAFWLNGVAVAAFVAQIFVGMYPNALPSTISDGFTLTLVDAAAYDYSLRIITVVALIGMPVVIAYQAWSFWVFRQRITRAQVELDAD